MDAPPLAATRPRRFPWILSGVLFAAVTWCGILIVLVLATANPPVLNRVQILASPVVVEGVWQSGTPPSLTISKVWKGTLATQTVTLSPPYPESIPTGDILVPLTSDIARGENVYQVTHGELFNRPQSRMAVPADPREWISQVRPAVYPATPDVLNELQRLLGEKNTAVVFPESP